MLLFFQMWRESLIFLRYSAALIYFFGVSVKIRCIKAYQVDLPLHEGSYNWSGGKSVSVFDSTIVSVETDEGITGYGEVCPLGPFYLPAYATGTRTGIAELAPHLIGEDPTQLLPLNQRCAQGASVCEIRN